MSGRMSKERLFFGAGSDDLGVQIVALVEAETLSISCNDEWCGSTESGFGATVAVDLSRDDALRLRDFLNVWLESK